MSILKILKVILNGKKKAQHNQNTWNERALRYKYYIASLWKNMCGDEEWLPLLKPSTEPARYQQRMNGSTSYGAQPSDTHRPLVLTLRFAATIPAGLKRNTSSPLLPKDQQNSHSLDLLSIYKVIFHSALLSEHRRDLCREYTGSNRYRQTYRLQVSCISLD